MYSAHQFIPINFLSRFPPKKSTTKPPLPMGKKKISPSPTDGNPPPPPLPERNTPPTAPTSERNTPPPTPPPATPEPSRPTINRPHFKYANIGGLLNISGRIAKLPILSKDSEDDIPILIALTETHLNQTSKLKEFHIPNFSAIFSHRKNRSGGGCLIYLNNNLTFKLLTEASDNMCSIIAIYINELKLVFILAYRPPPDYTTPNTYHGLHLASSFENIILNNIKKSLDSLPLPTPDIILTGDFNFPKATWRNGLGIRQNGNSPETKMLHNLINICDNHNLLQLINFGTRPTPSGGSNTLDLIFTNNHNLINEINHRRTNLSDHELITCYTNHNLRLQSSIPTQLPHTPPSLAPFNLKKADFNKISSSISQTNWPTTFTNKNCSDRLQQLLSSTLSALNENCPKYKNKPGQTNKIIPRDRRLLFRQRKKKIKILRSTHTSNTTKRNRINNEIIEIEQKISLSLKKQNQLEEEKAINHIKTNSKFFFSFANRNKTIKNGIGPLKVDEELITDPIDICEKLSSQYSSVFSLPDPNNTITDPISYFNLENSDLPCLTDIHFTEEDIKKEIENLKNNSAPGPDHFHVTLLKACKDAFAEPLHLMWRYSLDHNDIAALLKHGIISPIKKPGAESYLPKSYRPISLTSFLIKIFEKIVRRAIIKHLEENNLLPQNQHGFLHGRSTLSQLLNQIETIIRSLENGNDIDTIYLDFAKAFDKVDHYILCSKLKKLRIGGKVGMWLHNFLTNRTQQVSANGAISSESSVISGVPQGTVLGPILFVIMISDLDTNLDKAFASLFADDSRVSSIIKNEHDSINFQSELDSSIYPWARTNKAKFNGDKFEHIHFGKNLNSIPSYTDPNGLTIQTKPVVKDLGILISNDLNWSNHIDEIISNSRKQIAWLLRTFSKRDITTMRTLWISLIRPILDYCSPLWSPPPTNYGNIDRLEGVLRSFSKQVDDLHSLRYADRLKALNLQSIQRRHERYKIIYIYKIKEGIVPNLPPAPNQPSSNYGLSFSSSTRHGIRCSIPEAKLYHNPAIIQRQASFAQTASDLWNCLPYYITSLSHISIDKFKGRLDKFLNLFPDEPRCSAPEQFIDLNTGRKSNSIWHLKHLPDIKQSIKNFNNGWNRSSITGEGLDEVIPHP